MDGFLSQLWLLVVLVGGLFVCIEIGYRFGRLYARESDPGGAGQVGAIQGAMLGLLGLLLAFSFSAAASRFLDRQDLIATDANAIGTAFLRAELLNEPMRFDLQSALRDYRANRLGAAAAMSAGREVAYLAETDALHARIWDAALRGVKEQPVLAVAVLDPVNEVIDLHTTRLAASRKRLPMPVLGVLLVCSIVGCGTIGFGCGLVGRRRGILTASLALLVGATIYVTLDLDQARAGLLQLSDAPLTDMKLEVRPR